MEEEQKTFRFNDGTWLIVIRKTSDEGGEAVELEAKIKTDLHISALVDFGEYADEAQSYFDLINEGNAEAMYSNLRLKYRDQVDRTVEL